MWHGTLRLTNPYTLKQNYLAAIVLCHIARHDTLGLTNRYTLKQNFQVSEHIIKFSKGDPGDRVTVDNHESDNSTIVIVKYDLDCTLQKCANVSLFICSALSPLIWSCGNGTNIWAPPVCVWERECVYVCEKEREGVWKWSVSSAKYHVESLYRNILYRTLCRYVTCRHNILWIMFHGVSTSSALQCVAVCRSVLQMCCSIYSMKNQHELWYQDIPKSLEHTATRCDTL